MRVEENQRSKRFPNKKVLIKKVKFKVVRIS